MLLQMRRFIILFTIFMLSSFAFSQKVDEVFKSMPFEISPLLSSDDKDMLLLGEGEVSIPTNLGEVTRLSLTNTYIKFKTSKVGTTQIKLLTKDDSQNIICVINTLCDSICDSSIKFYSTEWDELDKNIFLPDFDIKLFVDTKKIKADNSYKLLIPLFYPVSLDFTDGDNNLNMKLDIENSIVGNGQSNIKSYIINSDLLLKWNGQTFDYVK